MRAVPEDLYGIWQSGLLTGISRVPMDGNLLSYERWAEIESLCISTFNIYCIYSLEHQTCIRVRSLSRKRLGSWTGLDWIESKVTSLTCWNITPSKCLVGLAIWFMVSLAGVNDVFHHGSLGQDPVGCCEHGEDSRLDQPCDKRVERKLSARQKWRWTIFWDLVE